MTFVADILLVAGALGAGLYCHVLSRRLRKFTDLEKGVGGAVAVLSAQVDDLSKALSQAQVTAAASVETLAQVNERAEASARRLQLLIASTIDRPEGKQDNNVAKSDSPFFVRRDHETGPTQ
jgi:outer membrane murein-binding lipoprotein Lpp